MAGLELDAVSKVYANGQRAVDRVSLAVEAGRFLVLVGPSGCGKSSLLRMIAGLEAVSEGAIRFEDRVLNELPPRERDVAMVFQNYALYPHMSVFQNLAFGLELRRMPRADIERIVRETASTLGLEAKLPRLPRELSGGERQRVALGRALVRRPKLFLFDEPLSNLDAKLRVQMRGEIHRIHQRVEATMVYVTHDQVEAMTLGERIAVLKGGVLQQLADPDTLYHRPANQFVAGFIGSPPMNLLAARCDAESGVTIGESATNEAGRVTLSPAPEWFAQRRGGAVTFGIRPEDLSLRADGLAGRLPAVLEVREPLGNEVLLYWSTSAGPVVSRLAGESGPAVGTRLALGFAADKARWFDPASEAALG
ncbi:MAG: sn-glycerol-3-phosphate ABC transporter ATP-binding protein UgpC [Candidatus Eisenbacteria bacterium]|uniref:sn-glycerol-3-phosphate ABC transporter ATP-binding protein UgpC n=1 Tax=Eiseniibacteriota bacterium TaxID=2212470 RepID=A0A849SIX1_UNCEI|nr:sn-glycerol-3-phosphate ABC transporter ATP-binding protein UgpC [Candidatus Eisenbacteria bacterium]